ncbi:MAG: CsgG/HfaB family protein [Opitutaceae bacterium]|jgi:curli biogenesis system outer membrane secretion channel CsgG|nr:CsgG/HfaB family protein [Opitutaceae bacterium]
MNMRLFYYSVIIAAGFHAGCSSKVPAPPAAPASQAVAPRLGSAPDYPAQNARIPVDNDAPAPARTTEYIDTEANGSGATEALAVQAALKECVGQVCGVAIASETKLDIVSATISRAGGGTDYSHEKLRERLLANTKGRVASYEVLSVDKSGATGVEVRARARVAKYIDPQMNRLRLAVVPFKAGRAAFRAERGPVPGRSVAAQLAQALTVDLVSTRKFAVLKQEYMDEIAAEQQLAADSEEGGDLCRLGMLIGADYIVCGSVEDVDYKIVPIEVPYTNGEIEKRRVAGLTASVRIVDVMTGQVKFADSADLKEWLRGAAVQSASVYLCRKAASGFSPKILESIAPMLVIGVEGSMVMLNQGGNMVKPGDQYELFTLGQRLRDPRTGESLGRRETLCGAIEIARSTPKTSEALLLETRGDIRAMLASGQTIMCRLVKFPDENREYRKNLWRDDAP